MSQRSRILRALERGPVSPTDFLAPACDGGLPILRVAPRVEELRREGHLIESSRAPNGVAVYKLVHETTDTRPTRGGATEPADTPVAESQAHLSDGHPLVHPAVDTPVDTTSPSGVDGQLFPTDDAPTGPRPHWQQEEDRAA